LPVPAAEKTAEAPPDSVAAPPSPPPITVEPIPEESAGTLVTASKPAAVDSRSRPLTEDDEDDWQPPERYDEDEDDFDVRRPGGKTNNMALASMILGITSVSSMFVMICCCGMLGAGAVASITGVLALVFGFLGKAPGSESYTMTGLICGGIGAVGGACEFFGGIAILGLHFGFLNR
jgi:hypothetical protein